GHVCTVPATDIALTHVKRPVPNAVLLGALSAVTGVIKIDSVIEAIETKFPGKVGQANITAAKVAYAMAQTSALQEATHA
ncbi:MAG: 2-oxoacid:acceptor oxidoreductase family protein, partial [Candidatus Thiodiazotropha endolucinida]